MFTSCVLTRNLQRYQFLNNFSENRRKLIQIEDLLICWKSIVSRQWMKFILNNLKTGRGGFHGFQVFIATFWREILSVFLGLTADSLLHSTALSKNVNKAVFQKWSCQKMTNLTNFWVFSHLEFSKALKALKKAVWEKNDTLSNP